MTQYNIALIGFGGVNRAFAQLIAERNDRWQAELGFRLNIVAVSDLNFGSVLSPNGIDARMLVETKFDQGGFKQLSGGSAEVNNESLIKQAPADIVVEATFTNPRDGEPGVSHCRWALESGKHVVTTNKGPVVHASRELKMLAAQKAVSFEYEGAVMSGTPVLRLARRMLSGAAIRGVEGILNGTSNFILMRMENGAVFADAVKEAQALGYAEADPSADVEGYDVRLKVAILADELFGEVLNPQRITCQGISDITMADIESARRDGCRWKLIGSAMMTNDGRVQATVEPRRLPFDHPLSGVSGAINAVSFETELLGTVTVTGPGAGRTETAFALLSDIIAIHQARFINLKKEAA